MGALYQIVASLLLMMMLQGCSKHETQHQRIITIQPKSVTSTLFYSGTILPLRTVVVTSPVDGTVIEMPFQYGDTVKAGQLLFTISSTKFLSDYKTALMSYIKAKSEFNNSKTQLAEAKFLHQHQLISDDDYKTKQSNYYASRLALLQAKDTLENLLHQSDIKDVNLDTLTIADVDKITRALRLESSTENLRILAIASGVILAPLKNDEGNKKVNKGDAIKQGEVLSIIGDMSGVSVRIKVNELTVNQLKIGQKVKITGPAFAEDRLSGTIEQVDKQGESSGSGFPTFPVEVVVPHLSPSQQKQIHVGMSAQVEISMEEDTQITIPMSAIKEKNGLSFVDQYDEKTKRSKSVPVKTGKTTMDSVAILEGLKVGDKIMISTFSYEKT